MNTDTLKMTVTFSPGDERVSAVLRELIPPGSSPYIHFENQHPDAELPLEEVLEVLYKTETLVAALPNHESGCQALALRRSDSCDCRLGQLHSLLKDFRKR